MTKLFRTGPAPIRSVVSGIALASLSATLMSSALPPYLWKPNLAWPWTFLTATLVHPGPGELVLVVAVLLLTRKFFDGHLAPAEYAGIWFGSGAVAHLTAGLLFTSMGQPFAAAAGIGGTASCWALAAGYAHVNGQQYVHLNQGMFTLRYRDAAIVFLVLQLASGLQQGRYGVFLAARATAGLAALAWFRREELKEVVLS